MRSTTRRRTRLALAGVLALVLVPTGLAPAAADDTLPPIDLTNDIDLSGVFPTGTEAESADVAGPGYNLFGLAGLLPSGYTVRLITSSGVDDYRDEITYATNQLATLGIAVTVASGTIPEREPNDGETTFEIDDSEGCDGGGIGCAGPSYGSGPDPNKTYVRAGRVWIRSGLASHSQDIRRKVVAHELGHALNLAHYDEQYNAAYQVMKQGWNGVVNYQDGDRNGFAYCRDYGVYTPPPPPPPPGPQWRDWETLGGTLVGEPDVSSWGAGRLDVFSRGVDGTLQHRFYEGRWFDWESLGGTLASDPTAVSWGAGRVDVFARGTDNALIHKWYDGFQWHDWESLGGSIVGDPDVSSWGPGRLDVFARAADGTMQHKWYDGSGWHDWESLGGTLASDPTAVSWGAGRVDVFARGTDGTLIHKFHDNGWWPWESLGGTLLSAPDASSWGGGRLDVFALTAGNQLGHKVFDGQWHAWESRGGTLSSGPGAVSWSVNRVDVFARDAVTGSLAHLWYG
jgi:hypothetical protein